MDGDARHQLEGLSDWQYGFIPIVCLPSVAALIQSEERDQTPRIEEFFS